MTIRAVSRSVHIAGDRPLRFSFCLVALFPAFFAFLGPRVVLAQTLGDLPEVGLATDATPAPAPSTPAPPATTPAASAAGETIAAQVGTRAALRAQNPTTPSKINDVGLEGEADVVLRGRVHPFLKWQTGFIGAYGPQVAASAALLDLVAKLEFAEAFNLWVGRMPIPSDRTSLSTVWAIAPWTLPGRYSVYAPFAARPAPGPRQGNDDRGDGATLWGQLGGGTFKYYLGVFGLDQPTTSPLYSARLAVSLLGTEPGFAEFLLDARRADAVRVVGGRGAPPSAAHGRRPVAAASEARDRAGGRCRRGVARGRRRGHSGGNSG